MEGFSSKKLKEKKEEILCLWEQRCLKEVSSAGSAASLALRNSIPIYLDHLSQALADNKRMDFRSVFAHDQEATRIGKLHGADRAGNRSYLLTEVIFEYHILREVIFEVLETEASLQSGQRDIIYDSIEQAVNDAAVEFSDIHADIQQKFIATLTHDLKTPISAAKMNAQLILKRDALSEPASNSIKRIIASLNRLDSMIHDLLDASRIRAGEQLSLQYIECDLSEVIRDVVDEMAVIHGDRFVLIDDGNFKGNWAADGLRRAVENLMGNAVKYGAPNSAITVTLRCEKSAAEIAVHNQGRVISEDEIPLLFQKFRRSKSAEEGKERGWGLGLTLVKGVVLAHKGKIRVESAEGKGTKFIIEIPFADGPSGARSENEN